MKGFLKCLSKFLMALAVNLAFGITDYRMAILKQQWIEVLPVVIGGIVIGAASSLATLLVG